MGLIQASRQSAGGGGGLTITGWQVDTQTQNANFAANTVSIPLTQTPVDEDAILVDYNGQRLLKGTSWSYDSVNNEIDILFGDPYVTDYDTPPYFQVVYPY